MNQNDGMPISSIVFQLTMECQKTKIELKIDFFSLLQLKIDFKFENASVGLKSA